MIEDGRQLDTGHVLNAPTGDLEVTGVSYEETPEGRKHKFSYTLRHKDELDVERAEAEAAREQAQIQAESEAITDTVG